MARWPMPLLTQKQLAEELGLKVPGVISLTRKKKIPVLRISHRCVRYDLEKVRAALNKFEVKAIN
ncbi:MAG: hypothetical protein ABJF10_29995 [Chthoniobacter sp.]|uniref:helix-turn-helix transcriptional regulator n=1 Tax=Chthoniobacter sp. TaxID=2510640 RepID=UPI0032A1D34F